MQMQTDYRDPERCYGWRRAGRLPSGGRSPAGPFPQDRGSRAGGPGRHETSSCQTGTGTSNLNRDFVYGQICLKKHPSMQSGGVGAALVFGRSCCERAASSPHIERLQNLSPVL